MHATDPLLQPETEREEPIKPALVDDATWAKLTLGQRRFIADYHAGHGAFWDQFEKEIEE